MNKKIILLLLAFSSYGFAMKRTTEEQNFSSNKKIDAKDQTIKQQIRNETKDLLNRIKELPNEIIEHEIKPVLYSKYINITIDIFSECVILKHNKTSKNLTAFSNDRNFFAFTDTVNNFNIYDLKNFENPFLCQFNFNNQTNRLIKTSIDTKFVLMTTDCNEFLQFYLLPKLHINQIALVLKLEHLTKAGVNCNFLFDDTFYLDIFNQFNNQQQKNICQKFKLDIYDKNLIMKNLNQNLLMRNILEGNTHIAIELINYDIDLNAADVHGNTALIYAVHTKNLELIKLLVSKADIDIYHTNKNNISAIGLAKTHKNKQASEIILEALIDKYFKF